MSDIGEDDSRAMPTGGFRISEGAFAIATRPAPAGALVLLRWNRGWNGYNFVGGHVEPADHGDFRVAAARETQEETGLIAGEQFDLLPLHEGVLLAEEMSQSAGVWTHYRFAFFLLELTTGTWESYPFWQDSGMYQWVTVDQIEQGVAPDGRPITRFPSKIVLSRFRLRELCHARCATAQLHGGHGL